MSQEGGIVIDPIELKARQGKIEQVLAAQERDVARMNHIRAVGKQRAAQIRPGKEILERFQATHDAGELKRELGSWGQQPGFPSYGGVNGQMFLNQLVNYSADPEAIGNLLAKCIQVPASLGEAALAINDLATYARSIRQGGQPAPRRSVFFLSFLWSLQDPDGWPCFWPSAEKVLYRLGWLAIQEDLGQLYLDFREVVQSLGGAKQVEHGLYYLEEKTFLGLDPSILDRCRRNLELGESVTGGAYPDAESRHRAGANAGAIIGELGLLGKALADRVAEALGRPVNTHTPSLTWSDGRFRGDGWVSWAITDKGGNPAASVRVWVTGKGAFIGLHPGFYKDGWFADASLALQDSPPLGAKMIPFSREGIQSGSLSESSPQGEFLLAWPLAASLSDPVALEEEIVRRTSEMRPELDRIVALFGGRVSAQDKPVDESLRKWVERFLAERPYPSTRDEAQRADREVMAGQLAPDEVRIMDIADLRAIYGSGRYGSPGPQSVLHTTIRDASPAELEEYLERIHFLLWGEGDDADRIDAMLDQNRMWIKGLGESSIMKMLSIVKPNRYLPIFPYAGDKGKSKLMKVLGITPPPLTLSLGHRQVQANDAFRELLDPLFPNDPWGQAQFCYWRASLPEAPVQPETDVLAAVADKLLVRREFITEIVELLRKKKQMVFYGPPGTGKTYVARALAEALTLDPGQRAIVQFHPSTSYEDFFEGYRPEESHGQLTYQLRKGPLALLAERADANPGVTHVLVIDELNRANLPKVFGELLYLLEYRGEQIQTLYRPEEPFALPENLLIICTMNTADRSIALVDAALRRRFHFIPFFPDDGEMEGLLHRWLEQAGQALWVAEFVDFVNEKLSKELGGPDLQLGPSYFMKIGVAEALPKIWKYDVEPLIQDQLFGQVAKIRSFTYAELKKEFDAIPSSASES